MDVGNTQYVRKISYYYTEGVLYNSQFKTLLILRDMDSKMIQCILLCILGAYCSDLCSNDTQCKGYSESGNDKSQIATTFDCPESGELIAGDTGILYAHGTCGQEGSWKGCNVKINKTSQ